MNILITHGDSTYIELRYVIYITLCIVSFHVLLIMLLIGALKNTFVELNDIHHKYQAQKLCMKELCKDQNNRNQQ